MRGNGGGGEEGKTSYKTNEKERANTDWMLSKHYQASC